MGVTKQAISGYYKARLTLEWLKKSIIGIGRGTYLNKSSRDKVKEYVEKIRQGIGNDMLQKRKKE